MRLAIGFPVVSNPNGLTVGAVAAQMIAAATLVMAPAVAFGESPPATLPVVAAGSGAMPGGQHVGAATFAPKGTLGFWSAGSFGRRGNLLSDEHVFHRFSGSLAVSYAPITGVMAGLSLDGRVDKHYGLAMQDTGYVGDPKLWVRGGKALGAMGVGGQLTVWFPGRNAPSVEFKATTIEAKLLASFRIANNAVLSANAGYRLDNSGESVTETYPVYEQVSLGVSNFDAAVLGAHAYMPFGKAFVGLEAGADMYIGDKHPGATLRGGLAVGFAVAPRITVQGFGGIAKIASVSDTDIMAGQIPTVPRDTTFTVGLGLAFSAGGPTKRNFVVEQNQGCAHPDNPDPNDPADRNCPARNLAVVEGTLVDEAGAPMVGAQVNVKAGDKIGSGVTDSQGNFTVGDLPLGNAEITVELDGKKPLTKSLVLAAGKNAAAKLTLETLLPPGEFRGVVRNQAGKPLVATVKIPATAATKAQAVTSRADGTFEIPLAPGTYAATIAADGYAPQTINVVIEPNGVDIKNVDLQKK